ncbi:hypothetical protein OPQ81_010801 [Rhizoctonia solani]|nr:hypothetical protein OPQ81_010801 [Rhizoctonia solani]
MEGPTPSPAAANALHELEVTMEHIFASKCLAIAGFCILCYDHSLTFFDEVELIWKQKRSLVSVFFVLVRYVTPLVLIVDVYDKGGMTHYIPDSFQLFRMVLRRNGLELVRLRVDSRDRRTSTISDLPAFQVHAIWGKPLWLSVTLSILFAVYFVTTAVIAYKYQIEFSYTVAYNTLFHVCFAQISPYLWICWLPALVLESFIFILTLIKAIEHSRKRVNTPVLYVLYRDGIVYFIVICCCSIFNMMVWLFAPHPRLRRCPNTLSYPLYQLWGLGLFSICGASATKMLCALGVRWSTKTRTKCIPRRACPESLPEIGLDLSHPRLYKTLLPLRPGSDFLNRIPNPTSLIKVNIVECSLISITDYRSRWDIGLLSIFFVLWE